jgi:caa(3)-type oxidase subunit IV
MTTERATVRPYLTAYLALVVLAGVSLVFSRAVHWDWWDLVIDLAMAVLQASIVLWVFMHLSETSFQIRFGVGVAVSLLLTLLLLTVADVATRRAEPAAPRPGPTHAFYRH